MRKILSCVFILVFLTFTTFATESDSASSEKPETHQIDFFDAMNEGLIETKVTMYSSLDGRITVKNKTDKQLRVKLPETFAATPIAQLGLGGIQFGMEAEGRHRAASSSIPSGVGSGGGSGGSQSTGGGFGGGGGSFSIAPEKVLRQYVKTVCLEHGKREPRRHMDYQIRPLESVTDKKEVHALCSLVGTGKVDQQAAQAAVWHYNNGMSWEELAQKQHRPRVDSPRTVPYFSRQQIMHALNLGKKIEEKLENDRKAENEKSKSNYHAD